MSLSGTVCFGNKKQPKKCHTRGVYFLEKLFFFIGMVNVIVVYYKAGGEDKIIRLAN